MFLFYFLFAEYIFLPIYYIMSAGIIQGFYPKIIIFVGFFHVLFEKQGINLRF